MAHNDDDADKEQYQIERDVECALKCISVCKIQKRQTVAEELAGILDNIESTATKMFCRICKKHCIAFFPFAYIMKEFNKLINQSM